MFDILWREKTIVRYLPNPCQTTTKMHMKNILNLVRTFEYGQSYFFNPQLHDILSILRYKWSMHACIDIGISSHTHV